MNAAPRKRELTAEQVSDVAKCQSLLPREAEFIGKKGYRRTYREDGSYEWRYRFQQNDGDRNHTKRTKAGHEVLERMRPFMSADAERHAKMQAKEERVTLRDRDGGMRVVSAGLADDAARRNGWSHGWRARGNRVESGAKGMLFRLVAGEWEGLGVYCLGVPLLGPKEVPTTSTQPDPDGHPHRFVAGEWRKL